MHRAAVQAAALPLRTVMLLLQRGIYWHGHGSNGLRILPALELSACAHFLFGTCTCLRGNDGSFKAQRAAHAAVRWENASLRRVEKPHARTPPSTAAAATRDTLPSCRVVKVGSLIMSMHGCSSTPAGWCISSGSTHDREQPGSDALDTFVFAVSCASHEYANTRLQRGGKCIEVA